MFDPNRIMDLQFSTEKQIMDRKSARIRPVDLAIPIVAMANADGGWLAIGIEDDGTITGIDAHEKQINELVRVPFDFCIPSVKIDLTTMDVTDQDGKPNHILRMYVYPSEQVIANQADEVYLRVGDKSKKLNFEQRLQLVYAKGVKRFEDQLVAGATMDDLDLEFVSEYCRKIGYTRGNAAYYLRHNKGFVTGTGDEEKVNAAAILLFGKDPQRFFPRARIRFVRFEGTTAEVGDRMNVIKDISFKGRLLDQVRQATDFVRTQIREYTKLGECAIFRTIPEYPEFCWTELIVNAVAHRDYSIMGTDIQIRMFDDHFVVESPGILPGLVRISNIREFHFSRNPKIVELLTEYEFVKELGEGVDRIYREMAEAGLPEPEYHQTEFMLVATLKNKIWGKPDAAWRLGNHDGGHETGHQTGHESGHQTGHEILTEAQRKLVLFCSVPRTRVEMMDHLGLSARSSFHEKYLKPLLQAGVLVMTNQTNPRSKDQKYVAKQ